MRTVRLHMAEVALIVACLSLLLSAFLYWDSTQQAADIKGVVSEIQQSRVVLSKQSCQQRNNEREVQRSNLRQSLAQLARISDSALAQLGFTRKQAEAQIHKQLRQVAPLDCKRLVHQVATNRVKSPKGGGSESGRAPRPTSTTVSKPPTGRNGGSGPVEPPSPPERGGTRPEPPQGGGGSVPPPNQGGGGDHGGVVTPEPPAIPHPDAGGLVQSIVDGVGRAVQRLVPSLP